jgi:hypothetical protein
VLFLAVEDYDIPSAEELDLHHFYRAMAWLGEEVEGKPDGALAPRCVKDLIEERLFDRRRDLFTDLSVVFMDTTSLSFCGEGGETLGEHGYSKDFRPDLKQMILGLVVDGDGRPIALAFDALLAGLGERPACRVMVGILALAFERSCEAELALALQAPAVTMTKPSRALRLKSLASLCPQNSVSPFQFVPVIALATCERLR